MVPDSFRVIGQGVDHNLDRVMFVHCGTMDNVCPVVAVSMDEQTFKVKLE